MQGTDPNNPIKLDEVVVTATTGVNHISENGIKLIQHFESCKLNAYLDSVGVPTLGWGNTYYENGKSVKMGDTITQERADALFKAIIVKFEDRVLQKVKRALKQQEFDAAVSFCYNAGTGYKAGVWKDFSLWANIQNKMPLSEIKPYWESLATTAGGKTLNGLVRRRKAEAWLYCYGELKFFDK